MYQGKRKKSSQINDLVVALTGASGVVYGKRFLEVVKNDFDTYLIITEAAKKVFAVEAKGGKNIDYLKSLASKSFDAKDIDASLASGSFPVDGMAIVPCSMKTLASIANGFANNLVVRAADIALKEGRPLVIVPRETPLNSIQIENMLKVARTGASIVPASPAFYHSPENISDLVDFVVGRTLDVLGLKHDLYQRWHHEER